MRVNGWYSLDSHSVVSFFLLLFECLCCAGRHVAFARCLGFQKPVNQFSPPPTNLFWLSMEDQLLDDFGLFLSPLFASDSFSLWFIAVSACVLSALLLLLLLWFDSDD